MLQSFINILPIILFLFLGIFFKKRGVIKQHSITDIKFLVANITLPALIFRGFMAVHLSVDFLIIILLMFLIPLSMLFIGKVSNNFLGIKNRYFPYTLAGFENGMMGYALFITLFGSENLSVMATVDLGQGLFVFLVLLPLMNYSINGKNSVQSVVFSLIKSPVIIAILLGLVFGGLNITLTENSVLVSISDFIDILGSLTMPLIMISLGFEISFKRDGLIKAIKTVLFRKSLLIIFVFLVNNFIIDKLLHLPQIYESALLVMFLMPPPFVISIFMDQDDRESLGYVTNTLSISIILSLLLLIPLLP